MKKNKTQPTPQQHYENLVRRNRILLIIQCFFCCIQFCLSVISFLVDDEAILLTVIICAWAMVVCCSAIITLASCVKLSRFKKILGCVTQDMKRKKGGDI